jgi:hypothetical protein
MPSGFFYFDDKKDKKYNKKLLSCLSFLSFILSMQIYLII